MSKEMQMIELLVAKTQVGSVAWTPSAEEDTFITTVVGKTISLQKKESRDDQGPDFILTVLDEDGREVLSSFNGAGIEGVDYQALGALHELARRSAFNVDKTLDKIIQGLEEDIPF